MKEKKKETKMMKKMMNKMMKKKRKQIVSICFFMVIDIIWVYNDWHLFKTFLAEDPAFVFSPFLNWILF